MDFIRDLGTLALGSRLRRLSDQLMASGAEVYRTSAVDFEPRWFPIYRLLVERGPATVGEAAEALGLTHAAVSQTARGMGARGILASERDPEDERRRVLSLTDEGRALLPQLREVWADVHAAIDELIAYAGIDVMAAVDGLEHAAAEQSLYDRVAGRRRERLRREVEYARVGPDNRDDYTAALGEGFAAVNYEWLGEYFVVEDIDREVLSRPERILDDGGDLFFASVGGDVVGACALWPTEGAGDPNGADRGFELTKMGVANAFRGRGIGSRLIELAIERARERGLSRLFLMTNSKLAPALALYRRVGFRVVRSGPHPKYDRCNLLLELDLSEAT